MQQGKEEKTQQIFASNERELSYRWRERVSTAMGMFS
jgi:hypothetical protein